MDTLAFGYVIPAIRAYSGLVPVRQCSCRAYKAQASTAAKAAVEACVSKHIDAKGMRIVGAMVDVSEMIIKIFQIACVVASHMTLNLFL